MPIPRPRNIIKRTVVKNGGGFGPTIVTMPNGEQKRFVPTGPMYLVTSENGKMVTKKIPFTDPEQHKQQLTPRGVTGSRYCDGGTRKMRTKKYSESDVREAAPLVKSISKLLQMLNVAPHGGNYWTIRKAIKEWSINTSHFTGELWNKGIHVGPKRPIDDYLSNKYPIGSHKLKKRLISEGILTHICMKCRLTHWLGVIIPIELHHKDGNSKNNAIGNIELLCPNCHSMTGNYRNKTRTLS